MNKRSLNGLYLIWVKMIDLQKKLGNQNECHVAMKKIKSFCKTKYPTKEQCKDTKEKQINWVMMMKIKVYTIMKMLLIIKFITLI